VSDDAPGLATVHPRMHRRRIAVRRDADRRRLKRAAAALSAVAVLLGAYLASQTPLLDVDRVEVDGAERTTTDDILRVLGVAPGDPMVGVDTRAAARRVEQLPWIDEATVRRSWPGGVTVGVTERRPVAVLDVVEGRFALVDGEGRVLVIGEEVPEGLVALEGVRGPIAAGAQVDAEAADALVVAEAVVERLPGVVAAVSVDLDADLAAGGTVRFGSVDDLDDKVVALETVLANVDVACLGALDVRIPRSPALTRNQGCS
jgi:cell division protein FtsQ